MLRLKRPHPVFAPRSKIFRPPRLSVAFVTSSFCPWRFGSESTLNLGTSYAYTRPPLAGAYVVVFCCSTCFWADGSEQSFHPPNQGCPRIRTIRSSSWKCRSGHQLELLEEALLRSRQTLAAECTPLRTGLNWDICRPLHPGTYGMGHGCSQEALGYFPRRPVHVGVNRNAHLKQNGKTTDSFSGELAGDFHKFAHGRHRFAVLEPAYDYSLLAVISSRYVCRSPHRHPVNPTA